MKAGFRHREQLSMLAKPLNLFFCFLVFEHETGLLQSTFLSEWLQKDTTQMTDYVE